MIWTKNRVGFLFVFLGLLQAWANRFYMNSDGISYIEIAQAYARGQWQQAFNTYWSPLYSWILAIVFRLFKPSLFWEFPLVHLVNFLIYLFTLAAFSYLLKQFLRWQGVQEPSLRRVWIWLGYSLFLWCALSAVSLYLVSPDLLTAGIIFLAAGLWIRLQQGETTWTLFGLWGAVLGIGYLAKTFMFIFGFLWIVAGVGWAVWKRNSNINRYSAALAGFLFIAVPFVGAISKAKGQWTLGEAAPINYAFHVNRAPILPFWRGDFPPGSKGTHPPRLIMSMPRVYAYDRDIPASYPIWYDPSYWMEGLRPRYGLIDHWRSLRMRFNDDTHLLLYSQGSLWAGALILLWGAKRRKPGAMLLLPGLLGVAIFAIVLVEPRYIGPFVVLIWFGVFSGMEVPTEEMARKWFGCVVWAMLLNPLVYVGYETANALQRTVRQTLTFPHTRNHAYWQVAQDLHQLGLREHDRVACMFEKGYGQYWAHLGAFRLVAEIPFPDDVSQAQPPLMAAIADVLRQEGIRAIVAWPHAVSPHVLKNLGGWQELKDAPFVVYLL
ncbi:MAG: hypothetical protein WC859_09085 [Elusimicrobiota bacterium]|jgi:hypothetical protein